MHLTEQTAAEQSQLLSRGEVSARELVATHLARIEAMDPQIGAFLGVSADRALADAEAIDQKRAAGAPLGPLAGLPVTVKDNLCDRRDRTTCASRMLQGFRAPYDATVVARLRSADAVVIGRTNMDEFAMGGSTERSAFQPTRNPWDTRKSPGGSSGGAAASVAAGMAPLAIGSDTGGSIRQPAAYCGCVGVKPTYGRVSRYGLIAFASSLDQVGPLARTTEDAALLLSAIAGHDPADATSLPGAAPDFATHIDQPIEALRVGVVAEHLSGDLHPDVLAGVNHAIGLYRELGAQIVDVDLPHSRYAVACYYVIAPAEASSNLARYDGIHYGYRAHEAAVRAPPDARSNAETDRPLHTGETDSPLASLYRQSRSESLGPEVKRRIMLGAYALSAGYYDAYYLKAARVRALIREDYEAAFARCDVLVGPATPGPAEALGAFDQNPLGLYLLDLFTVGANLAGLPAMSLPCGFSRGGLPIGLHLVAPPLQEVTMLRAARMVESAAGLQRRRPPAPGGAA